MEYIDDEANEDAEVSGVAKRAQCSTLVQETCSSSKIVVFYLLVFLHFRRTWRIIHDSSHSKPAIPCQMKARTFAVVSRQSSRLLSVYVVSLANKASLGEEIVHLAFCSRERQLS